MAERTARGRATATPLRGYQERQREFSAAFSLPDDTREWVTVRYDPKAADADRPALTVSVCALAGHTTTTLEIDGAVLGPGLAALLKEHREALHQQLKLDLATNLMAASQLRGDE